MLVVVVEVVPFIIAVVSLGITIGLIQDLWRSISQTENEQQ